MATIKVLFGQKHVVNRLYGHIGSSEHCMEVSCFVVQRWHEASMQV
jgi:hypothetical protein